MNVGNPIKDRIVLITGGTGFIGRMLVNHLTKLDPKEIRLLSNSELEYYQFEKNINKDKISYYFGDVRDYERLKRIVNSCDIVIHAAALKRIDLMEFNVSEAVKTNIMGTLNVINACIEENVEKVVLVSTDKACFPLNSYGATKMLAERLFIESNFVKGNKRTKFTAVRYGNVLQSTGSVIPFFLDKIKQNSSMPLTDEGMTRFLISSDRAVQEILFALNVGAGGDIFVPKLNSMKITDLIAVMAKIYKVKPNIIKVGIRPGEKIHELLVNQYESKNCFELDESYVITPFAGKYANVIKYEYLKGKKPVDFKEYSSEKYVISQKELENILVLGKILNI